MSYPAWFVTLTYAEENCPDYGRLRPRDLRNFIQRVRRSYPEHRIGYYQIGEYGDRFQRPHYHSVLFGAPFHRRLHHRDSEAGPVYRSPVLENCWQHGNSEFTRLTFGSASYVAGYVRKKAGLKVSDHPNGYPRVDAQTGEEIFLPIEFSRMSLKPAIGLRWLQKYWKDVFPSDRVVLNGTEFKPPRYYDKAFVDPKHDFPGISYPERVDLMSQVKDKRIAEQPSLTEYQLLAKETAHKSRMRLHNMRM